MPTNTTNDKKHFELSNTEPSAFDVDTSKWGIPNAANLDHAFDNYKFTTDISKWDLSSVVNLDRVFDNCKFTGDTSVWIWPSENKFEEAHIEFWKLIVEKSIPPESFPAAMLEHYQKHIPVLEILNLNTEASAHLLQKSWLASKEQRNAIAVEAPDGSGPPIA